MSDKNVIDMQAQTISKLQEEIKLLKFDNSKNLGEIRMLKEFLKRRNVVINKARLKLKQMKIKKNYSDINSVLLILKEIYNSKYGEFDEE